MRRLLFFLILATSSALAHERLIVLGGSLEFPKEAVTQFADWSQGEKAKVLIIPWATDGPEYVLNIKKQFAPYMGASSFTTAPTFPMTPAKKAQFLKALDQATGVFFTGGNQAKIWKTIRDNDIRSALTKKFKSGTPFAGTSAGTAIMSKIAIIAEGNPSSLGVPNIIAGQGLCFLPSDVTVDQHFLVRHREWRLGVIMLANPGTIGLGIDEPAGFIVEDGIGKAVGPSAVMVFTENGEETLTQGNRYDLLKRARVK